MSSFHLLGGQIYPLDEIGRWLEEVGFTHIRHEKIAKASSALIIAESGGLPRT